MATYYVDAATGNDTDDGLSEANAWLTLGKAASTVAAGDKVNVKAGTYNEIVTLATSGTADNEIVWEGYTTTVGDGTPGIVVVEGGNTRATCLAMPSISRNIFRWFAFQGATTQVLGWSGAPGSVTFFGCKILKGSGTAPVSMQQTADFGIAPLLFVHSEVANFGGDGIHNITSPGGVFGCEIHDNGGDGIDHAAFRSTPFIVGNLIYDNTGDGIKLGSNGSNYLIANNTIVDNGGDGIEIGGAANDRMILINNIFDGNGGWNINIVAAQSGSTQILSAKNFYRAGTSGHINDTGRLSQLAADVLLTGDPFTAKASDDYSLDNTADEGAAVRAAALINAFPRAVTVGYLDGGAVQHQDPAGGSGGGPLVRGRLVA